LDSRHSTQEEAFQKIIEDYESLNNTQVKNFSTENGNIIRIDTNSFHKYIDNNDEECFGCYAVNPRGYEYYSNPEDSRYGASLHTTTVDLPLECEDWDRNEILNLMNSKKAKWSGKYTQFYYWTLD
jgi:hypothetical protein